MASLYNIARCKGQNDGKAHQGHRHGQVNAAKSEVAPITAGRIAPPMMAITISAEPTLRCSSLSPSIPSAKMVGNITDMKKLLATRA